VNALPLVTVLLPVRNEAGFIERSVGSVLAQDYPVERMEIIVIDGDSNDGTQQIVQRLMQHHTHLRLIANPKRIVATGLNLGIAQSRGDIVVRVDGHCEIAPDYVRCSVAHIQRGMDGVGGALETIGQSSRSRVIAAAMSSRFGVGDSAFRTVSNRSMLADTVPFPAYSRRILEQAGPFDEELVRNQDDEYNYRLRKLGARIFLAADVKSTYYSRGALRSMWSQYFQYGYWKVRVMQKHPRQMRARQFAPPVFVAALIAAALAAPFSVAGRLSLAVIVVAYAVANLVATASVIARNPGLQQPWLLPVAFAGLHTAYGLGFLTGLVSFWNRWHRDEPAPRSIASTPRTADMREETS
jgi:glycosyltransferase involved in cell wall biosynthesis